MVRIAPFIYIFISAVWLYRAIAIPIGWYEPPIEVSILSFLFVSVAFLYMGLGAFVRREKIRTVKGKKRA